MPSVGSASQKAGRGGGGRIAVYFDNDAFAGGFYACGGSIDNSPAILGGAGTTFLQDNAQTLGNMIIDNCDKFGARTELDPVLTLSANLTVGPGAKVSHCKVVSGFHLTVNGDVSVQSRGSFDLNGIGHPFGTGPGIGDPNGDSGAGGAGHGGPGGKGGDGREGTVAKEV